MSEPAAPPRFAESFTASPTGGGPMDLAAFLSRFPWEQQWLAYGPPIDVFIPFEFPVTREELWPFLADTSTFNRRLGLSPMQFEERDGKLYGKTVNAGFVQSWEEVPWEWEYAKGLNNARIYDKGFTRFVRGRYLLEDAGPGTTRLYVYFGFIPRNTLGRVILGFGADFLRTGFTRVLGEIVAGIKAQREMPPPPLSPLVEGGASMLEAARKRLLEEGLDVTLVDRVLEFARSAPDDLVARARVRSLARRWGAEDREVLRVFLHATRAGVFTLTWDLVCPHCRGVRNEVAHLGDVPPNASCEACGIEFDCTQRNALEVTFHVHPAIRRVEKLVFCSAEPARRAHILVQRTLAPGQEAVMNSHVGTGRYRVRCQPTNAMGLVDVVEGGARAELEWSGAEALEGVKLATRPTLKLQNPAVVPRTFVMEHTTEDEDALRAADLVFFQEFRDLFALEAVPTDIQLDVGRRVVMFTDLVGSTAFYEQEGDAVAFAEVRRHFVTAYEIVQRHHGLVIKTVGDAVMAMFDAPADATRAALELQRFFNGKNPATRLRIRITAHAGPCMAVHLEKNIDLFGGTVNLAAKLQSHAEAGQFTFTPSIGDDPEVQRVLAEAGLTVEELDFPLKWAARTIPARRVTVE